MVSKFGFRRKFETYLLEQPQEHQLMLLDTIHVMLLLTSSFIQSINKFYSKH